MEPLNPFRHPDLSPPRCRSEPPCKEEIDLEDKEVAYVLGRSGTTKDKLARVSGAKMNIEGNGTLIIEGEEEPVERGKKYVHIILSQRHGTVELDASKHEDDLDLLDIPTDCKGFVTGTRGATLRSVERQCASLMSFCTVDDGAREPLAIFGTRRARLHSRLKIMSVVEGKKAGFFCKDGEHPEVEFIDADIAEDDWGVTWFKLDEDMIGYALGKGGETRTKLQTASGAIVQYIGRWACFAGTVEEQARGKQYLEWLLEQQGGEISIPVQDRDDVTLLWVPEICVGYVTGMRAKTLRRIESKTGTFCFFIKGDNDRRPDCEKMCIFSFNKKCRKMAWDEVNEIVEFHQSRNNGRMKVRECRMDGSESVSPSRSKSSMKREKSGSRSNSRKRSSSRKSSRGRSRSYSRSRSRSRS